MPTSYYTYYYTNSFKHTDFILRDYIEYFYFQIWMRQTGERKKIVDEHTPSFIHKFKLKILTLKEETDVNVICYLPKTTFPCQTANVPV